jgi:hypothetical protein
LDLGSFALVEEVSAFQTLKPENRNQIVSMITPALPDTATWLPRSTAEETLEQAFHRRCLAAESLITRKIASEREMNIDNFDSGPGVEDIVREELGNILPKRYEVTRGVVNDRDGKTAGDTDIVVFNSHWFPHVKAGATQQSRRLHLPIEGTYAVGEIKQTLNYKSLDEAMEKLVVCHRLNRPRTFNRRLVENRESTSCVHGLSNPLYSFVIAVGIEDGIDLDELVERFFFINKSLKRLEVVRALCVLGQGTVIWGLKRPGSAEGKSALFMQDDLYEPIHPVYYKQSQSHSPLYALVCNLSLHLFHSVLAAEDIALAYGPENHNVQAPTSDEISLQPDPEWMQSLHTFCNEDH